jgi:S-formylglutathione hydrolase
MYSYIVDELPAIINKHFPTNPEQVGVLGHSMGGHGALVIALRNADQYQSVSAFSPIVTPTQVPWGQNAFAGYLGADESTWQQYDATELINSGHRTPNMILIDQGTGDDFLQTQLRPEVFEQACQTAGQGVELRMQTGYDHSYYFIASFMQDHIAHHAAILNSA